MTAATAPRTAKPKTTKPPARPPEYVPTGILPPCPAFPAFPSPTLPPGYDRDNPTCPHPILREVWSLCVKFTRGRPQVRRNLQDGVIDAWLSEYCIGPLGTDTADGKQNLADHLNGRIDATQLGVDGGWVEVFADGLRYGLTIKQSEKLFRAMARAMVAVEPLIESLQAT